MAVSAEGVDSGFLSEQGMETLDKVVEPMPGRNHTQIESRS
jgi:hypothetical protein